jgi:DNA-binding MarR family transcriptional regulator
MEAARRIDEWQVLSKRIPSTHLIPVFTNQSSSTSISFTPQEWSVICKIDERRSIDEIAAALGLSAFEVCKLLYGLVTAGLVELKESLGQLQTERLKQMSASELALAAKGIFEQARALLANHDRLSEVEATTRRTQSEMESGRGFDAVLDMIRSIEQVVSSALGPNQSRVFLERVNQQLSG